MKTIIGRAASIIAASLIAAGVAAQVTQPKLVTPTTPSKIMQGPTLAQTSTMVEFAGMSFPALSWSRSSSQSSAPPTGAGMSKGSSIDIVKVADAASPQLKKMASTGQRGTLTITVSKGGKAVEQVVCSGAWLASYTVADSSGQLQERLVFLYTTMKMVYL